MGFDMSKWGKGLLLLLIVGFGCLLYYLYTKYKTRIKTQRSFMEESTALSPEYIDLEESEKRLRSSFSDTSITSGQFEDEDPDELIRWAESNLK